MASDRGCCLRDCGLVVSTQQGRYVSYQLSTGRVDDLLQLANGLLSEVARGLYACTRYEIKIDEIGLSR